MNILPQTRKINPWLTSLVVLRLVHYYCQAEELPHFKTVTFTANVTHRSSYCFMYEESYQGNIEMRDGLRGKNVSVALMDYHLDSETGGIDNSEIAVRFLDELASRAGFEWRKSYGVLESPSSNNNFTWDTLLLWGTDVYDVMGEWYTRNIERLEMGMDFVDSWYDGSMIMVMVKDTEEFQWFTFFKPFSWQVWILIAFSMICSAVFYYLIDYLDSRRKSENMEASLGTHMFFAPYAFTGHSQYQPRTISTQLLAFSLCFMYLVLLAVYTANMTSLFIHENEVSVVVNTIDDAIKADLTICVWKSAAADNLLLNFHKDAKRLPFDTEDECAAALVRGDCQVYFTFGSSWEFLKRDIRYNKNCHLDWVGRRITSLDASFVIQDEKQLCSKFLEDVLTLHMVDMKIDGTFEEIWNDQYRASSSHDCQVDKDESQDEELYMSTRQIGSLFMLHFTIMSIALIIAIFRCCLMPKEKKEKIKKEMKDGATNPEYLRNAAMNSHRAILLKKTNEIPLQGEEISNDSFSINSALILNPSEELFNAGLSNERGLLNEQGLLWKAMMINLTEASKEKDG